MQKKISIPGVNIQWPWSALIANGVKTVETRSYPLPEHYRGKPLALIETPGPRGRRDAGITTARIIGIVTFSSSFQYLSQAAWEADRVRHAVANDDPQFAYSSKKPKWGWVVSSYQHFQVPQDAPARRGIVFARTCLVTVNQARRPRPRSRDQAAIDRDS